MERHARRIRRIFRRTVWLRATRRAGVLVAIRISVPISMSRSCLHCLLLLAVLGVFAPEEASAQFVVVGPSITFTTAPRLVVVSPGIQVVQDYDYEVFFVGGYYWTRSGGVWFRSNHHRGRWVAVESAYVPRALVRIRPGTYRRYKGGPVHKHHHHHKHKHKHRH
jgi:hypothetical protein